MKMKTLQQITDQTTARAPSDFDADPPRVALVEFARDELVAVLSPRKATSKRAAALMVGVEASGKGSKLTVVREHLLVALGALQEEGDGPDTSGDPADV